MQFDGVEPINPDSDFFLQLNINSGDANHGLTRAEAEELKVSFEQATDGRELMNTIRVVIVNQFTDIIEHNDFLRLPKASLSKDGLKYKVDPNTDYKVYLIANEEGIADFNTLFADIKVGNTYLANSLEQIVIGSSEGGLPIIEDTQSDLPVPMTEIFDITTSTDKATSTDNGVVQNETFFITRAASKFSFYFFISDDFEELNPADNQTVIQSVKIGNLGKNEYLFPFETKYTPDKDADRTNVKREITKFTIPEEGNGLGDYVFDLPNPFKLSDLPKKPSGFNPNNTEDLEGSNIRKYAPLIYFPETKGDKVDGLYCTISFDGENYLTPVKLPNLPYRLPRNTHVVVIITVGATSMDVIVDVQPYAQVVLNPDFGLTRDEEGNILVRDKNGKLIKIIPYDPSINASLKDIVIGDMSYVEVAYNDVIKFREFLDENGVPDGRRQDFLTTGWNLYDKDGYMTSCFIYDTALNPNDIVTTPQVGRYMEFDNLSNLILEYDHCTESDDRTSYKPNTGTKLVWTKAKILNPQTGSEEEVELNNSYFNSHDIEEIPDSYKIYYKSYDDGKTAMLTILVVYEVKNGKKTNKVLTVFTEEGDVTFDKVHVQVDTDVIGHQEGVEIYQIENGQKPVLKYLFFNNGAYQAYYLYSSVNADPQVYDWDYYHEDGYRFSSFDHSHPRYDNRDVYSQYDKWGNVISRSVDATDNSGSLGTSHNTEKMVIDNYILSSDTIINGKECKAGAMIIKYRKRTSDSSDFYWGDNDWTPTYCINQDGSKIVLIS